MSITGAQCYEAILRRKAWITSIIQSTGVPPSIMRVLSPSETRLP